MAGPNWYGGSGMDWGAFFFALFVIAQLLALIALHPQGVGQAPVTLLRSKPALKRSSSRV
jgi:hypothetical protein